MKCPICNKGEVACVAPWKAYKGWGVAFTRADGKACCSMFVCKRTFETKEEAQQLADSKSLEQWAKDEGCFEPDEPHDLIGPTDY